MVQMRKRTKRTIRNVLIRKCGSTLIGIIVCALYGIPLIDNLMIAGIITGITLIWNYYIDKYFYNEVVEKATQNLSQEKEELECEGDNPYFHSVILVEDNKTKDQDFILNDVEPLNIDDMIKELEAAFSRTEESLEKEEDTLQAKWRKCPKLKVITIEDDEDEDGTIH